mmetsp:Transcript_14095/g.47731  ORF Transcript_14095/g.47731 Transcript_14095/m.47731 type:complete len:89 (-) Transcript_14095:327-593(-)
MGSVEKCPASPQRMLQMGSTCSWRAERGEAKRCKGPPPRDAPLDVLTHPTVAHGRTMAQSAACVETMASSVEGGAIVVALGGAGRLRG